MFKFDEYAHLLNSKNTDERLIGEYWYTKQKYRNLLRYVEQNNLNHNIRENLNHLSARLNDIRIAAALNGIKLGAVKPGAEKKTEAEKIKQEILEAIKDMDEVIRKLSNDEPF